MFWQPRMPLASFGDSAPCAGRTCRSLCMTSRLTGGRTLSTAANTATSTYHLSRSQGVGKWLRIKPVTSSPLGLQVSQQCGAWLLQATPIAQKSQLIDFGLTRVQHKIQSFIILRYDAKEQDIIADHHIRCCEMPQLLHAINIPCTFVVSKIPLHTPDLKFFEQK